MVNIPYEVTDTLKMRDGDEVDFFKYSDKYFLFAKKSDIVSTITNSKVPDMASLQRSAKPDSDLTLSEAELSVLKKLDTLRYAQRTKENVKKLLDKNELKVIESLLKKKVITLYKKEGESEYRVSIPKAIYDRFLFGKRDASVAKLLTEEKKEHQKLWVIKLKEHNKYADILQSDGYFVCNTEAEATSLSSLLEESIRQGLVVGTRAFNKKFYVALKNFVVESTPDMVKLLEKKSMKVEDIAKSMDISEDAVRTILYLLAEDGTVLEVRKDVFKAA